MSFHVPERYRYRAGRSSDAYASDESYGNNGAFFVPELGSAPFKVIASDGEGWEHVSVSLPNRCPTWDEMCLIKGLFWDDEDCVVQFHPPRSAYVNCHPYCLHLWRPTEGALPAPPGWMVGNLSTTERTS